MSLPLPDSAALIALAQRLETSGYRFITPTPLTHQHVNQRPENRTAASLRDVFGWSRLIPESMLPVEEAQGLLAAGILERKEDGLKSRVRFSSLNDLLLVHSAFPTADEDSVFSVRIPIASRSPSIVICKARRTRSTAPSTSAAVRAPVPC